MFNKYFRQLSKDINNNESPLKNALFVAGLYVIIGTLWILFSDNILSVFVNDPKRVEELQTVKGILFVLLTGGLFYFIIKKRLDLYMHTIDELEGVIIELKNTNETLQILEAQLHNLAYYDELTGLFSKNMIAHKVEEHIINTPDDIFGFIYLDIDSINAALRAIFRYIVTYWDIIKR